ncbi:MAG: YebC/PmpR family DNA-binding transcriptional regulator [Dehalococcoidales bacterium]|nr:YebC/PmpR family DNA-binding transcriptional regulator [Dehalococcoidales bacterium]
MSGHSKWHTIKNQKAATDAKRGQMFTKLTREIIVAARKGGGSIETNYSLRLAVQRAKDSSMPWDNISRAITKASGGGDGVQMVEMTLEGYGPGGGAVLVNALSDNRNRTVQAVRNIFTRSGGSLGESGCVAWLFVPRGVITVKAEGIDKDELSLKAIDLGAEDVNVEGDYVTIYTTPQKIEEVRTALEKDKIEVESAEVSMIAKQTIDLDEKQSVQTMKLLENLEELDDVQSVAGNVNFSDAVIAAYEKAQ